MRNALITCMLLLAFLPGGCSDDRAVQHAKAVASFERAIELLEQANRSFPYPDEFGKASFTDADGKTYYWPDVEPHRMVLLQEVIDQLHKPEIRGAAPQLRAEADRLMSQAYASRAKQLLRQAVRAYSRFAAASGAVVAKALTVAIARQRGSLFNTDYSAVLANYQDYQRETQSEIEGLKQQNQSLQKRLKKLASQIDAARKRRDELMARVQELRNQAFTVKGKDYFDLMDRATNLEVQANQALAEAQKLDATRDALTSELAIADKRRELSSDAIEVIGQEVRHIDETRTQADEQRSAAMRDQQALTDELRLLLEQLSEQFEQQVETPFEEASTQMDQAVKTAAGLHRDGRDELLSRQVDSAGILARRINAEGAFAKTLQLAAAVTGQDDRISSIITDKIARLTEQQTKWITQAAEGIAQAGELAVELAPKEPRTPADQIPFQQADRLNRYREMILASAIDKDALVGVSLAPVNLQQKKTDTTTETDQSSGQQPPADATPSASEPPAEPAPQSSPSPK